MGSDSMTNGSARGGGGVQIPASVKKVVQNLKEIVNYSCTDSEIYAVLRDCNMDPGDAVQRLLSQDTFHEVKSKRERRKEMKETQELKTQANGRASNRGVRDGSEHSFGQSGSTLNSFNELGKAAYKKENGSVAYMPYFASSKLHATGQTLNEQLFPQSNSFDADYGQSIGTGDMIDSSMQPSYGSQSSWVGSTIEHVAMADIVRMGRAKSKGSQMSCETSYSPQDAVPPNATIYQMKPSFPTSDSKLGTDQDLHSSDLNTTSGSGKKSSQRGFDNEWAVNEPMTGSRDIGGAIYSNQSYLHDNKANLSSNCWSDNILVSESNVGRMNLSPNLVNSAQASDKQIFTSDSGGTSEYDDDLRKDTQLTDSYGQIYERLEGRGSNASAPNPSAPVSVDSIKAASSVAVNLQQLSLGKEEGEVSPKEDNFGVVLPDYLQALSADCSHLSFGTYKSGKSIALPQPQTSSSLANNLEETLMNSNGCSTSMHLDSRNLVYHDREQIEFDIDSHGATVNARNYNSPKTSQSECRKLDIPDAATLGNDSCASLPGSSFKNIERSSSLSLMIDPNARNLPVLPSDMQSHSNSMPSDILAAAIQSTKARDSAAFLTSPSISSRYIGSASSIKNPVVSMSQPSSQVLHGANPATGPVLKGHLYAYSYPQNGYPAAPQVHTYTASTLRQAFPDGNVFREPHEDMKYDRKHYGSASMSSSSLPSLSSYTSGYQTSENPSNSPGSSLHNLLAGSAGSKFANENFLRSQYSKGGASFNLPQQNGGAATWDYGHGSRTISTIPDNANYSLRGGQNHLLAGYQQCQQQAQQHQVHGGMGYPGIYGSHAAMAMEQQQQQQQQQQNLRDLILNASQGQSSRLLPQTWQHKY